MKTARTVGGQAQPEKMEEMDRELTKTIEDFNHAVDVEVLRLAKRNGKHLLTHIWLYFVLNGSCRAGISAYSA